MLRLTSTPLHRTSEYGRLDTARLLLDHDTDPNACTKRQQTLLHLASSSKKLEVAHLLKSQQDRSIAVEA